MATKNDNRGLTDAYADRRDGNRFEYRTVTDRAEAEKLARSGWQEIGSGTPGERNFRRRAGRP